MKDSTMAFVIILAAIMVVLILYGIFSAGAGAKRFQKMGDIRGKPMSVIIGKVRQPTSVSASGSGGTLYQWMKISGRSGFHYAILADADDNAIGFTHQFVK